MPAFHQKTMLLPTRIMHALLLFTASEESNVPLGDVWKADPCSVVITEADARALLEYQPTWNIVRVKNDMDLCNGTVMV